MTESSAGRDRSRQPCGHVTDNVDPAVGEVEESSAALARRTTSKRAGQAGKEVLDEQEEDQGRQTHHQRRHVHVPDVAYEGSNLCRQGLALDRDTRGLLQLSDDHDDRDAAQVPHQDRLRQQVGDEAEAQDPRDDRDHPNDEREGRGQGGVLRGVPGRQGSDHGRGHECCGRFRTHGQLPGRAQHGIQREGRQDRPQADDGFEASQTGVRHDLRDQVRRHRDACYYIAAQPAAFVPAELIKSGEQACDTRQSAGIRRLLA